MPRNSMKKSSSYVHILNCSAAQVGACTCSSLSLKGTGGMHSGDQLACICVPAKASRNINASSQRQIVLLICNMSSVTQIAQESRMGGFKQVKELPTLRPCTSFIHAMSCSRIQHRKEAALRMKRRTKRHPAWCPSPPMGGRARYVSLR